MNSQDSFCFHKRESNIKNEYQESDKEEDEVDQDVFSKSSSSKDVSFLREEYQQAKSYFVSPIQSSNLLLKMYDLDIYIKWPFFVVATEEVNDQRESISTLQQILKQVKEINKRLTAMEVWQFLE